MMIDLIFLFQALVFVTVPFALSRFMRSRGVVPLVVIQILVGVALGPSIFGRVAPESFQFLFNPEMLARLSGAASIAVLFFGFITGLHMEADTFLGRGRAFCLVATASVAVPTLLGFLGGLWIATRHPDELGSRADPMQFAMAIAICVGVTALPVLGAILRETGLLGRRIGDLALGIAAVNDAALWLLLAALMTSVAGRAPGEPSVILTLVVLPIYLGIMMRILRPWLTRRTLTALMPDGTVGESALVVVCMIVIGSAIITQAIGLHYIFGAFIAGAIMPRELRQPILDRLQVMTVGVLMPVFFILTGLRTLVAPTSLTFLEIFIVTTALALLGKVGGTAVTARLVGEPWRSALGLGALVQTKGLMEVIVLTIMLDRNVISGTLFSALTLMAIVSTSLAMPLLRFALRDSERKMAATVTPPATPSKLKQATGMPS